MYKTNIDYLWFLSDWDGFSHGDAFDYNDNYWITIAYGNIADSHLVVTNINEETDDAEICGTIRFGIGTFGAIEQASFGVFDLLMTPDSHMYAFGGNFHPNEVPQQHIPSLSNFTL